MEKIIVYTTETWPHCKTAKVYLRDKGYSFEEKDVNKDMAARNDMIKRGIQGVPAFIIGDEVVVGLDTGKIERLINYKVLNCPKCNSRLRIPKGKGNLKITCPKCKFDFKMDS